VEAAGVRILERQGSLAYREVNSYLRRNRQVIVWAWGLRCSLFAKLLTTPFKYRLVIALREASSDRMKKYWRLERWRAERVTLYLNNSQAATALLTEAVPALRSKCRMLRNAIVVPDMPPSRPPIQGRTFTISMLGNINPSIKGYDTALAVAELLRQRNVAIQISVAGRDDSAGWFSREIARRGLTNWIVYRGETSQPENHLADSDLFLMLSRYEGTPNALIEALALGRYAVSTRVGDVPWIAENVGGVSLVDTNAPNQVCDTITMVMESWHSCLAEAATARRNIIYFYSFDAMRSSLSEVCKELGT
jgi:glycosyltransferase involved in cell wall biosynthesis